MYSDGSLLEGGVVSGGAFVVGMGGAESEVECEIGDVATVWDGEIAGMAGGLTEMRRERVLILADSKAAIAAVRRAGRAGKARSRHLQEVVLRRLGGRGRSQTGVDEDPHGHLRQ